MNEEAEVLPVPRWIVLVGGVARIKAYNMTGVGEFIKEVSGLTNDEIEIFTLH